VNHPIDCEQPKERDRQGKHLRRIRQQRPDLHEQAQEILQELSNVSETHSNIFTETRRGGTDGGSTWFCEELALAYAQYLSAALSVLCLRFIIQNWLGLRELSEATTKQSGIVGELALAPGSTMCYSCVNNITSIVRVQMERTERIATYVSPEEHKAIRMAAAAEEVSMSEFLRRWALKGAAANGFKVQKDNDDDQDKND
jgi:hypothetical protein